MTKTIITEMRSFFIFERTGAVVQPVASFTRTASITAMLIVFPLPLIVASAFPKVIVVGIRQKLVAAVSEIGHTEGAWEVLFVPLKLTFEKFFVKEDLGVAVDFGLVAAFVFKAFHGFSCWDFFGVQQDEAHQFGFEFHVVLGES